MNNNDHLDLFSGIGGFALAARWAGFTTVAFSEIEPACCEILRRQFPGIPNHGDIRRLSGKQFQGVSLVTGGFPCQPFSVAGKRQGKEDDRHLWPEMLRIISEAKPAWVVGENVAGIVAMELDTVLSDLEGIGYECQPIVIPACAVDARHRRDRVWILANSRYRRTGREGEQRSSIGCEVGECSEDVAHSNNGHDSRLRYNSKCGGETEYWKDTGALIGNGIGSADVEFANGEGREHSKESDAGEWQYSEGERDNPTPAGPSRWEPEPAVGRVVARLPNRAHRLRGLGNSIVPQVAYEILAVIAGLAKESQ